MEIFKPTEAAEFALWYTHLTLESIRDDTATLPVLDAMIEWDKKGRYNDWLKIREERLKRKNKP